VRREDRECDRDVTERRALGRMSGKKSAGYRLRCRLAVLYANRRGRSALRRGEGSRDQARGARAGGVALRARLLALLGRRGRRGRRLLDRVSLLLVLVRRVLLLLFVFGLRRLVAHGAPPGFERLKGTARVQRYHLFEDVSPRFDRDRAGSRSFEGGLREAGRGRGDRSHTGPLREVHASRWQRPAVRRRSERRPGGAGGGPAALGACLPRGCGRGDRARASKHSDSTGSPRCRYRRHGHRTGNSRGGA
jgi:hypothetical protein